MKTQTKSRYHVILIKPSKYDDEGYVVTWWRGVITSNSLACMNGLTQNLVSMKALGNDVEIVTHLYDETVQIVPVRRLSEQIIKKNERAIVCMVGVQTNQFARAVDLAREFRRHGFPSVIGGFHVSGCFEMLKEMPPEIKEALREGIALVAGEVETKWFEILKAAYENRLESLYNFVEDKPELKGAPVPTLPMSSLRHFATDYASLDAGRGCPFHCSFCTIINIQGNTMRGRSVDDIEKLMRMNYKQGVRHIFFTDDNFARHKDWEKIIDRFIDLKEKEGIEFTIKIQTDTVAHKIPRFIEKMTRAGCRHIFIGLESVNPENLRAAGKYQNQLVEYRAMLQAWRRHGALIYAGYIIGFPNDTYESILQDVEYLKREIPIDFAEFFVMTPLPGSKDHQKYYLDKIPMEADTNLYDTTHVCMKHPRMSKETLERAYQEAWLSFYSNEHILTLLKRHKHQGTRSRTMDSLIWFCASLFLEKIHPLLGGFIRIKGRQRRRPSFPKESLLAYAGRRMKEIPASIFGLVKLSFEIYRLYLEASDPKHADYMDDAITPVQPAVLKRTPTFTAVPELAAV